MILIQIHLLVILAFYFNSIECLTVKCDNRLNDYSTLNDTCYVKTLEREVNDKEKLDFDLWYTTPDKIKDFDIYTSDNQSSIDHIPTEVFDFFPSLETLRVNSKVKVILPTDLQKGTSITTLVVSDQLEKITKVIFSFSKQLQFLKLYGNRIKEIDDLAFDGLDRLFSLDLQDNELTEIRRNTFAGLPELHTLMLYRNQIKTIEDNSFQLPKLEHLHLYSNKLTTLSDSTFVGLVNIRSISLKNNQLNTINNSLYILQNIMKIDLRRNKITDVNREKFSKLPKLNNLKL